MIFSGSTLPPQKTWIFYSGGPAMPCTSSSDVSCQSFVVQRPLVECLHIYTSRYTWSHHRGPRSDNLPASCGPAGRPCSQLPFDAGGWRRVPVAVQPGRQQAAGPRRPGGRLREAHHPGRAPHLDGGVVAGGQQQLLVRRAEGHRVDHVVVRQARQADVVVAVPDVAVLVLGAAVRRGAAGGGVMKRERESIFSSGINGSFWTCVKVSMKCLKIWIAASIIAIYYARNSSSTLFSSITNGRLTFCVITLQAKKGRQIAALRQIFKMLL